MTIELANEFKSTLNCVKNEKISPIIKNDKTGIIINGKIADILMLHGFYGEIHIDENIDGRYYFYELNSLKSINGEFEEIIEDIENKLYKEFEY